jgi:hypothetical protein
MANTSKVSTVKTAGAQQKTPKTNAKKKAFNFMLTIYKKQQKKMPHSRAAFLKVLLDRRRFDKL